MNIMKLYEKNYKSKLVCSCGYNEEYKGFGSIPKTCPQCNANFCNSNNNITNFVFSEIKEYSFKATKTISNDKFENGSLIVISQDVYEITYDFLKKSLEIILNGNKVKNTKTNIKKALSRITNYSMNDFPKKYYFYDENENSNLFKAYGKFFNTDSMYEIYNFLQTYPMLEIFYNTYKDLELIKYIDLNLLQNSTNPSIILNLSKPVTKIIIDLLKEDSKLTANIKKNFKFLIDFNLKYNNKPDYVVSIIDNISKLGLKEINSYMSLVEKGFDNSRLYKYLEDDIYTYQGISSPSDGIELLNDYISMCEDMGIEYERYPKSLKLIHDLTNKNYELVFSEEDEGKFTEIVNNENYKNLEFRNSEYTIIRPIKITDIINEGRHLNHCVASYVNKILKKETKILFMRNTKKPEKSLITLEVVNGIIKQYKGQSNRYPNNQEYLFIKDWAKKYKLNIG